MQGITRTQIVEGVSYQAELKRIEDARRYVVKNSQGDVLTKPMPKITAEHFVDEQRLAHVYIIEEVNAA